MEIAGLNESISQSRVRGIVQSIPKYFPKFRAEDFADCQPWVGLRPCSPDGLPYLGRSSRWRNLVISTGHAMMGISLSMVSGRIASEIIDDVPQEIPNLGLLSPDRFSQSVERSFREHCCSVCQRCPNRVISRISFGTTEQQ